MKKERKIALIGTAPSSINLAPYEDESWEIWACSPGTMEVPRVTQLFEMHRYVPGGVSFPLEYVDYLKHFTGDIWMTEVVKDIPTSQKLPWEELVEKYGPYFFTSSLSWMMALAIEMNPKEIGLWGVDMASTEEYTDQKLGCQYFATLAIAQGIKVSTPLESDLFRPNPLYGVCQSSHAWIKQTEKVKEYNGQIANIEELLRINEKNLDFARGAKADLDYHMKVYYGSMENTDYTSPPMVPALK